MACFGLALTVAFGSVRLQVVGVSLSQLLSAVSVSKSWEWLVSLSLSPLLSGAHRLTFVSLKPLFHQFERVCLGVTYSAMSFTSGCNSCS